MSKGNGFVDSDHSEVAELVNKMGAFIASQTVAAKVRCKKKKKPKKAR